ncbi:MAG: MBL fold metallo-hydrolase [Nitrospinota bacterium]
MRIRFWGTRGSLPKPAPNVMRYGGNTACVEARGADGALIVLDCGTGSHGLGRELLSAGREPPSGRLLLSHTHWDHIQGFPFFAPLFVRGAQWEIYAPGFAGHKLERILAEVMSYNHFPVPLDELGATIRYHDMTEGAFGAGSIRVTAQYMNHPTMTLGYRLESGGAAIVYIPDHEPNALSPPEAAPGARPVHREEQRHVDFLAGADLLIHDAQYTLEEYRGKIGWGHSPVEQAVDYALAGGVKRLALFHHDPWRDDAQVDALAEMARGRVRASGRALEVFGAAEGEVFDLPEKLPARPGPAGAKDSPAFLARSADTILAVDGDAEMIRKLQMAMPPASFRLLTAVTGASALRAAREALPALIVLEPALPGEDGLGLCRALRAETRPELREVPILVYTGRLTSPADVLACYEAGATDHMPKSMPLVQLRARVCAWLLRTAKGA